MDQNNASEQSDLSEIAKEWLANEDSACRQDRLARLVCMAERINAAEYRSELGGLLGKSLCEEMRYCFAYGQFIAASLLGLAYIEQTLAAYFYGKGRSNLERAKLEKLLGEA